jgi:hypothetical protein
VDDRGGILWCSGAVLKFAAIEAIDDIAIFPFNLLFEPDILLH